MTRFRIGGDWVFATLWSVARMAPEGGGDGGGGNAPAGGGGNPPAGGGGNVWGEGFEPHQQLVQTKGWKSPADMAKGYTELESFAGRAIAIPGADAKPEEWATVYNKLGRPDSADKYDLANFKVPDGVPWSEATQKAMLPELHKLGLSNSQVVGAMQSYAAVRAEEVKALNAHADQFAKAGEASLRKDWGGEYDAKLDLANRAVKSVFGKELADARGIRLSDGTYLLDNPVLAKAFAQVGANISEDGQLEGLKGGGAGTQPITTPAQADAEIKRIRAEAAKDPNHPYVNRKAEGYKDMQAHMNALYALAKGAAAN